METEDPFGRAQSEQHGHRDEDEENLRWAALEKLPTYDRMRQGILRRALHHHLDDDDQQAAGQQPAIEVVDIQKLAGGDGGRQLLERLFQDDSERFLRRLRDRIDRVGIELPTIEVRYEQLTVEADVIAAGRALPTLWNAATNFLQGLIGRFGSSNRRRIIILNNANGVIKPSRMTLLLGPPSSGKSTLMRALTGKLDKNLKVSGSITYCGYPISEFYPERTSAYVGQYDLHNAEMTVRETLDFSRRCLGIGARYEMLAELARRERDAGIKPDPEIDAFMKATAVQGQDTNIITDVTLKVLGLDICADIIIGDEMIRGISGGQKKRVTTGEMLTGPARALFMDEISTGLDSSSTFQIVKYMRQLVHVMNETVMISLLQPPPETYNLFDDIILLSEGYIVYHGPRENILEFFESAGFRCPERKGVADFLQEVTSKKDQQQYWYLDQEQYHYVSVPEFAEHFKSFHVGQLMQKELQTPFERSKTHPAALTTRKYGLSSWESFKAVMSREQLLMKRNSFIYIFKVTQLIILALMSMTVFLRTKMPHDDIKPWWIWGYWASPMMYSQNAISINEFLASRWAIPNNDTTIDAPTVGKAILKSKGLFTEEWGFWLSIGALVGFIILFNILYLWSLTYLSPNGGSIAQVSEGEDNENEMVVKGRNKDAGTEYEISQAVSSDPGINGAIQRPAQSHVTLPFQPLSLCFNHVNYYVDMPAEMKEQGFTESRLQLLSDVSGAFRPGILTALVGVSGAGKTTLMDVLAGRKTSGAVEGDITLSGYPKKQETFARISGYCEQTDIHSPNVTVYESIIYSAWLRLSSDVDDGTKKMFVEEVMALVELDVLRNTLVGLPGVNGLSTEQRKRLTIAVELVANPSIIFMDEPTSGLDARAAAIVMRTACVEVMYNILQGILYTVIIYAMIGYDWKADKFFYFLFFITASFNYFTLFGMMLVACTPSALLANILITFALPLWNLFAGFLVVRPAIPIWWRWYYWANPVSWTIYGVVASQFGENGGSLSVPGGSPVVVKQFLNDNLGIRHDFLGYVVLVHFAYIIVFLFVFGYSIKFLNFQKR
nr:unnamed protein product [Digitaria exilis]